MLADGVKFSYRTEIERMSEIKIFGVLLAMMFAMPFLIAFGIYLEMSALQITMYFVVITFVLTGIVVVRSL